MTTTGDSLQRASDFIAAALGPLAAGIESDDDIPSLVEMLGWIDLPSVPAALTDLRTGVEGMLTAQASVRKAQLDFSSGAAGETEVLAAFAALVAQLGVLLGDLEALPDRLRQQLPADYVNATGIADQMTPRLYQVMVYAGVDAIMPTVRRLLTLLGIFEAVPMPANPATHQPEFTQQRVYWDRIGTLFQKPQDVMNQAYGWGSPVLNTDKLFDALYAMSFQFLAAADIRYPTTAFLQAITPGSVVSPDTGVTPMLVVPFAVAPDAVIQVGFLGAPTLSSEPQGLALTVLGSGSFSVSTDVAPALSFDVSADADLVAGIGAVLKPNVGWQVFTNPSGAPAALAGGKVKVQLTRRAADSQTAIRLLTVPGGEAFVEAQQLFVSATLEAAPADFSFEFGLVKGRFVVPGGGDGFTAKILPSSGIELDFDFGIGWSQRRGVFFTGSGGLQLALPLHLTLGPFKVDTLRLALGLGGGGLQLRAAVVGSGTLGPVTASVDAVGIEADVTFQPGNLGPLGLSLGPAVPNGYGIAIDAGPVSGGGFLYFGDHRYAGAMELSVYSIAVKAFGLIDTLLPDGTPGFSFVVIISAEFTPIQLGFGFTLIGVGGLVGINRSLNGEGLSSAVRAGTLDHVLFPSNPVRDAPAIINDLTTIFPATKDHYVFGPMAKLGWGTPALINAELGIVLEIPGPRLTVLGIVQMALPTSKAALLSIHLAVQGTLDFPKQSFSFDASLYDSHVAGFNLSGDMAFRLSWGRNANFALAIGGFNPAYQPPPGFPTLRRIAVDAGINGNPRLTIQGYFALTSNTVQTGASLDLHASGFGIDLDGHLGFDALFVFAPFSFQADFSAGVSVSFHGVGFGIGLHGSITGPSPFHVDAKACVSILFWDACLPVSITFGASKRVDLPPMDPYAGKSDLQVVGLKDAILDPANWSGGLPSGAHPVVTLTQQATADKPPIDPVGQARLQQKVCPFNFQLSRFGAYKPVDHTIFNLHSVQVDDGGSQPLPAAKLQIVSDQFAPAQFKDMGGAEKLSSQSYRNLDAGFTINPDTVVLGDIPSHAVTYDTDVVDDQNAVTSTTNDFTLTLRHLLAMLERCASARGGIHLSGTERFFDPTRPILVLLLDETFVVADACSLVQATSITAAPVPQVVAQILLDLHLLVAPADRGEFQVVPSYMAA